MIIKNIEQNRSRNLFHNMELQWIQYWEVFLFLFIVIAKVLYYGKQISPEYFDARILQPPVIASILPIVAISYLFKNNARINFLYIVNIIISIILFADTVYYRYFKDVISIGAIKDSFLLKDVSSSIGALISVKDFFYLIDVILFIPLIIFMKKVNRKELSLRLRLMIFMLLISLGVAFDGKFIYALSKEQPLLIKTMSNKLYLTKVLGNINFHILDGYNFITNKINNTKKIPEDRKNEIVTFLSNKNESKEINFTGVGSGKNLIVIQVEALQQFVINNKVNGEEITPNLNKWINKSMYFDNYFYQVAAGNTSDAEFMSNNSLYPAASGSAYYQYTGNTLNSLPKLLKDNGYTTAAFHGYIEGFWNRNVMYNTEGFDNFYGEHSFKLDDKVGLGLSDKSFFNQSIDKIKQLKSPFYSFMVTLSSHFPYDDVSGYGDFNVGNYENTLLGNYLKGIHYTDAQLGMFLDKLQKEGILDNSIVVIYGDHNAIPKDNIQQLYEFEGVKNTTDLQWYQYQKVPMIIHFPKDEYKGVNHTYSGQMDLYPTLANLFNLSNKYMFGKDILNTSEEKVVFRNGSFTDGKIFYVSWTNTYYDIKSGKIISETPELKIMKENALKQLKYSDDILNHNLIKNVDE
ncbi:phosphoglycerol transferase MdoB-like AlkP superfamily enzyme [Clostridium tetanomorphum]|nr:sulfatase [Clostridium tetanomorphum DSM 665]MBP1864569.1 phosphoglycerol transferase MdoB-like AlkP superfamily enzyme [Clostridium tetanomorphum]NRS84038.1 phosphoglycerol transferase MdoB-like AlkP superfamily enzyme [Clostridium tetanomorphum]NRZ97253.1 phosphoglycerol transferase MdoB-like AlkP superfamily enzyme [Clostridium tetanomorphum]SQB92877.1 sulfatase family protein [Clostridium tetanomorphum]